MQRVALIGAGSMGRVHAAAYAQMANAELAGVYDIQPDAAKELADLHSVPAFESADELISSTDATIVDICVPTPSHFDYVMLAADARKHICCEKPLARTLGQAQEVAKVCQEQRVRLFTAHVLRWFPEYRKLHDLIADGAVGNVVEVRTSRAGTFPEGWDGWYSDFKRSGGVVLDLLIHDFDWLRWCFGPVKRVYAEGLMERKLERLDYALVTLRFQNGIIAHVEGSWAKPHGFATSVEVAGSEGLLSFSSSDSTPVLIERRSGEGKTADVVVPESPHAIDPYYEELMHFVDCIENDEPLVVSPEDAVEAVRVAEAALRSINVGQPITLV